MASIVDIPLFYRVARRTGSIDAIIGSATGGFTRLFHKIIPKIDEFGIHMLILDTDNQQLLQDLLAEDRFVVACLCAAWCDTCKTYQDKFLELSALHPEERFVWIDIEDNAHLVGDLDINNFPTLLIQRQDTVAFFGTVLPDARQTDRLLRAQMEKSVKELVAEAQSNEERLSWQRDCNLRVCFENA